MHHQRQMTVRNSRLTSLSRVGGPTVRRSRRTIEKSTLIKADSNNRQAFDNFDEGAAQVRRLLDRDRKEIDFGELEKTFESDGPKSDSAGEGSLSTRGAVEATPSNSGAVFAADKSRMSPFGPSPGSLGAVPFESGSKKPSIEPRNLSPDMKPAPMEEIKPWWTKITLTQVVIVLSFTTIISLMIATFFFVLNVGAIRLNE